LPLSSEEFCEVVLIDIMPGIAKEV
jgi:hypothetical protein